MGNQFIPNYRAVLFLGEETSGKSDIIRDFLSRVPTKIKQMNENTVRIHVGQFTKLSIVK